jgi:TRAP-type mannitol/chloroaromatic compound transport system substrate-binding protein
MGQLAWYMQGGGRALYLEYYQQMLKADVMPFLYAPDGPECFGWFKKPITSVAEFTKLRFRISSGLPSDVLKDMGGVPVNLAGRGADPRGRARRDRRRGVDQPRNDIKVGLQDVFKYYSIQGLHQAIDIADVVINMAQVEGALARPAGDRGDRAHHLALRRRSSTSSTRNAKALVRDQAQGRDGLSTPRPTTRPPSSSREEGLGELEKKDRSSRRCSTRSAAFRKVVVRTRARPPSSRRSSRAPRRSRMNRLS